MVDIPDFPRKPFLIGPLQNIKKCFKIIPVNTRQSAIFGDIMEGYGIG